MNILYLSHHIRIFYRNKTEYLKAYTVAFGQLAANMPSTGIGKDKVCLCCAKEGIHLFATICFKGVLFMSPSSSSDFNFLLFTLYTISVVHFFAFKSKEKKINE